MGRFGEAATCPQRGHFIRRQSRTIIKTPITPPSRGQQKPFDKNLVRRSLQLRRCCREGVMRLGAHGQVANLAGLRPTVLPGFGVPGVRRG